MSPLKQTPIEKLCVPNLQGVRTHSVAFHYLSWLQWELQLWADSRIDNKTIFTHQIHPNSSYKYHFSAFSYILHAYMCLIM